MSPDTKDQTLKILKAAGRHTKIFCLNMWRRGLILGRYSLACWQQQKLNRGMRNLGRQTFQALERGEANPLVASEVSQVLQKTKDLKELKDKNYQAIAALRDKIRTSRAVEFPPPPEAPPEAPPDSPGPEA